MLSRILSTAVLASAVLMAAPSTFANVVTNGGFETGDISGWDLSGNTSFVGVDSNAPNSGSFGFFSGSLTGATLSQTLPTTADEYYLLEFWLQNEADQNGVSTSNDFSVFLDGVELMTWHDAPAFGYTKFGFNFTATGPTHLEFRFRHEPAFWDLDDVSVNVPEPATLFLLGLAGLASLAVRRRPQA